MAIDDRLLRVLRSMNEIGCCSVLDLHRATGISRPSVHRVVDSLCHYGYAERIPSGSHVRLTSKVRALSAGYRDEDWVAESAVPILAELQKEVRWPSSLATPDKAQMIVRETTRHRSPFVFDTGGVGFRLPLLNSSLGLAYMAFCGESTRAIMLSLLRQSTDRWDRVARNAREAERRLKVTSARGYAFRMGGHEPKTSSIGVPILTESGAAGSLCITFVTTAVPHRQAVDKLLPPLQAAAAKISQESFKT
jgi:IclR family mhp operon transcriptional activator